MGWGREDGCTSLLLLSRCTRQVGVGYFLIWGRFVTRQDLREGGHGGSRVLREVA